MKTGFTSYSLRGTFFILFFMVSLFFFTFRSSYGQTVESDERALLYVYEGIRFSKDSLFLMNLRFRMQNRAGLNTLAGDKFIEIILKEIFKSSQDRRFLLECCFFPTKDR